LRRSRFIFRSAESAQSADYRHRALWRNLIEPQRRKEREEKAKTFAPFAPSRFIFRSAESAQSADYRHPALWRNLIEPQRRKEREDKGENLCAVRGSSSALLNRLNLLTTDTLPCGGTSLNRKGAKNAKIRAKTFARFAPFAVHLPLS